MKTKKKLVVRSITIKEEAKNVLKKDQKNIEKRHMKGEKYITPMIFSDVSENSKVYYGRFLRNEHYEGIAIVSTVAKSRWHVQYLEVFWPLLIGQEIKMELDDQNFAGACPWMSIRLLRTSFIKGQASSCTRYICRERVWYCNIDDTGTR